MKYLMLGLIAETGQVLGGYSLVETATIDEAVELARAWPGLDRGWITMEARPVTGRPRRPPAGRCAAIRGTRRSAAAPGSPC